jgi:hypothetical protein
MFVRETIKFLIPTSLLSLNTSGMADREIVPLYINPTSIQTNYTKNISETQTIGGFIIQYWGDRITTMSINGTTGSGGIDAINILYQVYKSEQIQFKNILLKRQAELASRISEAQTASQETGVVDQFQALDQVLFNGAFSNIANGVSETMDFFKSAVAGNDTSKTSSVRLLPTMSAFAVSLDMHFQGKVFRGYIDSMSITENASSPGHFDYTIQFKSLKEYGERTNFMPWHINPRDEAGKPIQKPKVGPNAANYNLSFPYVDAKSTTSTAKSVSRVTDDQVGTSNETGNLTPRYSKIK